jgi:hypothetical protein
VLRLATQRAIQPSVTTSPQKPEAPAQSSLASYGRWATDVRTVLAVLGIVLYAVLRIAYSVFYSNFGLTPDDLGLGYLDLLVQSAVGTVILFMAVFTVVALVVAVYVGLIGHTSKKRSNLTRRRRPAGSSTKRPPSVKKDGESATSSSHDNPRRTVRAAPKLRNLRNLGYFALSVLLIVGIFVGPKWLVLPAVLFSMAQALPVGIERIKSGLAGEHHNWWQWALVTIALVTVGLTTVYLLLRAKSDAIRVQDGQASSWTVQGFRITTWGAQDAMVSWTSDQIAADLRPLAGHCLMYLGQSNGTAFLYLVSSHEVFRVPTAAIVVRTQPAGCSRK